MEKKNFGFKKLVSSIVVFTIIIVFILFFASFRISIAEKPVLFLISGVFVMSVLMLLYEAMCYRLSWKDARKTSEQQHEIALLKLKFEQEQAWRDVDSKDQEIEKLKEENKILNDKLEATSKLAKDLGVQ